MFLCKYLLILFAYHLDYSLSSTNTKWPYPQILGWDRPDPIGKLPRFPWRPRGYSGFFRSVPKLACRNRHSSAGSPSYFQISYRRYRRARFGNFPRGSNQFLSRRRKDFLIVTFLLIFFRTTRQNLNQRHRKRILYYVLLNLNLNF